MMNRSVEARFSAPVTPIISSMIMHARDRLSWVVGPWLNVAISFGVCLLIAIFLNILLGPGFSAGTYTGALATIFIVMVVEGVVSISGMFRFAVGFSVRRTDFFLGAVAMSVVTCAAWAIVLGLLSLVEANIFTNWGVNLHFFHLPFFSDGAPMRQFCWTEFCHPASNPNYFSNAAPWPQFWVYFILLLGMYHLGMLLGSIYRRFGQVGEYVFLVGAFLLLSILALVATQARWWGAITGWFAPQTAATLGLWLVPLIACCALASYALLRKADV